MTDHYETLGVPHDADRDAIRKAYRSAAQQSHPDKGGNEERFLAVQAAWDTLGDDHRRKHYDQTGDSNRPPTPEEEAEQKLVELFDDVVANERFTGNIIEIANQIVVKTLADLDRQQTIISRKLEKLRKNATRITRAEGFNAYEWVIAARIQNAERTQEAMAHDRQVLECIRELLTGYKDEAPEEPTEARPWSVDVRV